jgi:S1-C subfamily serine protease
MNSGRALCVAGVAAAALLPAARDHAPAPRVVAVAVTSPAGAAERATGFAASRDEIVTVAHVLDAGGAVTVDGRAARVLRVDRRDDLALLAVAGVRGPRARTTTEAAGDVRLLLRTTARPARIRRAITATVRIEPEPAVRRPALELAADVAPGDSGAPLVDARGRVAGVIFATSSGRAHTAYAVDARAVTALLLSGRRP